MSVTDGLVRLAGVLRYVLVFRANPDVSGQTTTLSAIRTLDERIVTVE